MKTIQVVLEDELLREVDREARRARVNRSRLIREALRQLLRQRKIHELEGRHRQAYGQAPETAGEFDVFDVVRAWPDE
jgi:metal-responsive CopG/Arc/MetJ family transcriptional regulator